MNVLVVNAGGVTLELTVMDGPDTVVDSTLVDPWDGADTTPVETMARRHAGIAAVAHRVVHGGSRAAAALIDDAVLDDVRAAADLAPLHQERALRGIDAARTALPDTPHVACFDSAFHTTLPDSAATYALPAEWRVRWPLRRAGFHGLSHQHVARRVGRLVGERPVGRVVSCHLGSGASLCAVLDGRSVDTTMGMTPLDGLVMVSRPGSVDPGALVWLLRHGALTVDELADGLHHRSGLVGLAGGSGDMRDVVARCDVGDAAAVLAFDVYIHRLRREIGAMAAVLGGVDVLAFTGGVGQHMAQVRRAAVGGLSHLGLVVDDRRNADADADADIGDESAPGACVVVATGEHHTMAAEAIALLADRPAAG